MMKNKKRTFVIILASVLIFICMIISITIYKNITNPVSSDQFILFSSTDDNWPTYSIYAIRLDGTGLTKITNGYNPACSSDGAKLAFVRSFNNQGEYKYKLFISDIDGSNITEISNRATENQQIAWSPDGKYIAYISDDESLRMKIANNILMYGTNIKIFNMQKFTETLLLEGDWMNSDPSWSPDGGQLIIHAELFSEIIDNKEGLYIINKDGNEMHQLISGKVLNLDWSPNGDKIVYLLDNGDLGAEMLVISITGELIKSFSSTEWDYSYPKWSPDGGQLIFLDSNRHEIVIINAKTYEIENIIRLKKDTWGWDGGIIPLSRNITYRGLDWCAKE